MGRSRRLGALATEPRGAAAEVDLGVGARLDAAAVLIDLVLVVDGASPPDLAAPADLAPVTKPPRFAAATPFPTGRMPISKIGRAHV